MLDSLLEALQEVSGRIMASNSIGKVFGAMFVAICLMSGIALLVTGMYLADPEGFDKRLSQVLVERPVVAGAEEAAEEEEEAVEEATEGATEEEAEEDVELEEAAEE